MERQCRKEDTRPRSSRSGRPANFGGQRGAISRGRSGSVAGGGVGSLTDGTSQPFESAAAAAWSRGRHADGWRGSGRAPIGRRRQTEATHLPRLTPPPPGSPSNIPGVKKDEAAAVRFYMKAAEDGHAESQYKMGIMKER